MLSEFTRRDISSALDEIVAELLNAAGVTMPPIDAFDLATRLSLTVIEKEEQPERARLVRLPRSRDASGSGTIVMRWDPRPERMHWAVAHEIGEHYAHRAFAILGINPLASPPNSREQIANALAGRILLPTDWFFDDAKGSQWDLFALKRQYSTASHELIARRMLDGEPLIIVTIFDNGRLTTRQTNIGRQSPPLTELERACQQAAHESGVSECAHGDELKVHAWPIHEPDWKREILRTELLEPLDDCC
jgi:hypothetical protein